MATLQFLAARAAGLDRLVFHTVDRSGVEPCREALVRLGGLTGPTLEQALVAIDAMGFCWGASNGNSARRAA